VIACWIYFAAFFAAYQLWGTLGGIAVITAFNLGLSAWGWSRHSAAVNVLFVSSAATASSGLLVMKLVSGWWGVGLLLLGVGLGVAGNKRMSRLGYPRVSYE
jgi:hypothetical protein